MFEKTKKWICKHRKGVIITASVLAITGTVAALLINGKKVKMSVKELAEKIVPDVPKASGSVDAAHKEAKSVTPLIAQADEMVTINDVINTFPRAGYIRHLQEGHLASPKKLAQAAEMGIDLKPGYTIVDPCMVKQHAA